MQTGLNIFYRFKRSGSELLSHALRRSTIVAKRFHGPVRNGMGCFTLAITTRSLKPTKNGKRHLISQFNFYKTANLLKFRYSKLTAAREQWPFVNTIAWFKFKPIEQLVMVSFIRYRTSTSILSTWWSATALIGSPGIEGGFPLRCFQRLSRPNIATLRCRWRDNRYTRGSFTPVLSY